MFVCFCWLDHFTVSHLPHQVRQCANQHRPTARRRLFPGSLIVYNQFSLPPATNPVTRVSKGIDINLAQEARQSYFSSQRNPRQDTYCDARAVSHFVYNMCNIYDTIYEVEHGSLYWWGSLFTQTICVLWSLQTKCFPSLTNPLPGNPAKQWGKASQKRPSKLRLHLSMSNI